MAKTIKGKPTIEVKNLLENMDKDGLACLNAVASDRVVWERLIVIIEKLISREEYLALREVRPYKSMDEMLAGSNKQVQRQGRALGMRFVMNLFKFSVDEVERREKNGNT